MAVIFNQGAQASMIGRGMTYKEFGKHLIQKRDKSAEEKAAAVHFICFYYGTYAVMILFFVIMLIAPIIYGRLSLTQSYEGNMYYGTVTNGMVEYYQNDMQYISLEESGLKDYDLRDGDDVVLFFRSEDDSFIKAVPEIIYTKNSWLFPLLSISSFIMVFWLLFVRNIFADRFNTFYIISIKRELCEYHKLEDSRGTLYENILWKAKKNKRRLTENILYVGLFLLWYITIHFFHLTPEYDEMPAILSPFVMLIELISMIFCIAAPIYLIVLRVKKPKPLYKKYDDFLVTQLLTENADEKIGYLDAQGKWTELIKAEIIQTDSQLVKLRCYYCVPETGIEFQNDNFIAQEDVMFQNVMKLTAPKKVKKDRFLRKLLVLLLIFILILLCNTWIYGV